MEAVRFDEWAVGVDAAAAARFGLDKEARAAPAKHGKKPKVMERKELVPTEQRQAALGGKPPSAARATPPPSVALPTHLMRPVPVSPAASIEKRVVRSSSMVNTLHQEPAFEPQRRVVMPVDDPEDDMAVELYVPQPFHGQQRSSLRTVAERDLRYIERRLSEIKGDDFDAQVGKVVTGTALLATPPAINHLLVVTAGSRQDGAKMNAARGFFRTLDEVANVIPPGVGVIAVHELQNVASLRGYLDVTSAPLMELIVRNALLLHRPGEATKKAAQQNRMIVDVLDFHYNRLPQDVPITMIGGNAEPMQQVIVELAADQRSAVFYEWPKDKCSEQFYLTLRSRLAGRRKNRA